MGQAVSDSVLEISLSALWRQEAVDEESVGFGEIEEAGELGGSSQ